MKCVFLLFENEFRLLFVTSVEDHNRNDFSISQRKVLVRFLEYHLFLILPKI